MSAVETATAAAAPPAGQLAARELLTRFLSGSGVEIGPGHVPLRLPFGGASVRYVDRWQPEDNRSLFPELGEAAAGFVRPDVVANLDTDRLSALAGESQDFVVASHVLEHLAEPLGQLADIHRVLRPGGVALILLPDRRRTFDRDRSPTPLQHLVEEHRQGVTVVADDHVEDFLRGTGGWDDAWDEARRREVFELHRRRSVHAHTWSQDEFCEVLEHTVREMGMRWELLDAIFVEEDPGNIEFGMALRRTAGPGTAEELAGRLGAAWGSLACRARAGVRTAAATDDLGRQAQPRAAAEGEVRLSRLASLPGYATARRLYRFQRRLRAGRG
ncbi:MAG TPA: methyltransferase domain-containing protein [Candidatus Dormibacteraeota bacterium]|nr:methyltransferase domain-containing protein [Candidatus Dormibacteraeota bacterium]